MLGDVVIPCTYCQPIVCENRKLKLLDAVWYLRQKSCTLFHTDLSVPRVAQAFHATPKIFLFQLGKRKLWVTGCVLPFLD